MDDMIPANPGFYVVKLCLTENEEVNLRRLPIIGWSISRNDVEPCTIPDWKHEFEFSNLPEYGVEYGHDAFNGDRFVTAVGILEPDGSVSTVTPHRDESMHFENMGEWTAALAGALVKSAREEKSSRNAA